jgi:Asp-tRNA(Asn)/Glu-tRNA(Gln) amidotransferase A subunit family amidase
MIAKGRAMSASQLVAILRTMHLESRKVAAFHETYDIFLTPTLAKPPVAIGEVDMSFGAEAEFMPRTTGFSPYTRLANCTGQPSMSVPLTWSEAGLPIGTMFTANFGDDAVLFRLAGQLERARPWWERKAAVFG